MSSHTTCAAPGHSETSQRFTAQTRPWWEHQNGLARRAWSTDMGPLISNCIFSDHSLPLCKVHSMLCGRQPLFHCFSNTNVTENAAQSFYFWNHSLQLFQSIIITKHAVNRLGDDRGQSFPDCFFQISRLIFHINLTIQPLITKEAVDFDGSRLQSLLATLVTSSMQLLRGYLILETLAGSCGLINQGTALEHQGGLINRIHLKRWSKGLFFTFRN